MVALGLADVDAGEEATTSRHVLSVPKAAQAAKGRATKATGKFTATRRKEARVGLDTGR